MSINQAELSPFAPGRDVLEEVALSMGIQEAFVEKDWYVTHAIGLLVQNSHADFTLVFTGGTSLSKAHKLIERFSEDIDFRIVSPTLKGESASKTRKSLSDFKHYLVDLLGQAFEVLHVDGRDGNRHIMIYLAYPTVFGPSEPLRPHIKLEFTLSDLLLPGMLLPVSSFVNDIARQAPEVTQITCIDPVENAADKLSAIAWRIPSRVRGVDDQQPDVVRHLHDLAKLGNQALASPNFARLVKLTIERDAHRADGLGGLTLFEKFDQMLGILEDDPLYPREYDTFVHGMSYAQDAVVPTYTEAIEQVKRLVGKVIR
ncbi:nucleotidyl transferase AbiEii/AbiGii toxin family protein [Spirosoma utsteinense]|uniref:Nucleotidyl transferase AbiEii/AbiGii toxin family protein n=1 Tax=Spirosoma utsteinense TaxID=2585773 RepID=A0ABR6WFX5_9BACT|nr:nucleotidyl transferase AbiEii/AbiGii toxin family protein [Spirosoma utsteinense]MBC3789246.1 hypothetical protein [Spirosoma utsteinense]MBC3795184.1 hypothetical protein [Spirosoma utsteinense]